MKIESNILYISSKNQQTRQIFFGNVGNNHKHFWPDTPSLRSFSLFDQLEPHRVEEAYSVSVYSVLGSDDGTPLNEAEK